MAELKTKPTKQSATDFLNSVEPEGKRQDSLTLLKMFRKATGEKPVMWGSSIVGFGSYHYKSERSSQEGDWLLVGFSPRKANLTLYVMSGLQKDRALLRKLGKHKTGGGCLYINKLADVDEKVLATLIEKAFRNAKVVMTKAGFKVAE
ncbi:MAG: DUF1801 domain-containing protein [Anaerolineales bacterium]